MKGGGGSSKGGKSSKSSTSGSTSFSGTKRTSPMASEGESDAQLPLLRAFGPVQVHPSLQGALNQVPPHSWAAAFRFPPFGTQYTGRPGATYDKLGKPRPSLSTRSGDVDWSQEGM